MQRSNGNNVYSQNNIYKNQDLDIVLSGRDQKVRQNYQSELKIRYHSKLNNKHQLQSNNIKNNDKDSYIKSEGEDTKAFTKFEENGPREPKQIKPTFGKVKKLLQDINNNTCKN